MKVISLLQPWAQLVVMGAKKVETRSWDTKYRGPLLIHASVGKKEAKYLCPAPGNSYFSKYIRQWTDLPYGAIIGSVTLEETFQFGSDRSIQYINETNNTQFMEELSFGDWSALRYGWLFINPHQFTDPIPAKGSLGLWEYNGIQEA